MKEYDIKITEVLEKTVQVQADSREEAEAIASENWNNSLYEMDSAEDYADVSFHAGEDRENFSAFFILFRKKHIVLFYPADLAEYFTENKRENRRKHEADKNESDPIDRSYSAGITVCRIIPAENDSDRSEKSACSHT